MPSAMDSLDAISNRIDQLESKLGVFEMENGHRGDSIAANLASTGQCLSNAILGHEKLAAVGHRANELNNYTDPRYAEKLQELDSRAAVVESAAAAYQHHCDCMHQCHRAQHVLSSEALQTAAGLEPELQRVKEQAWHDQEVVNEVSRGISDVVNRCGEAASVANESVAAVARKLDDATSVRSVKMDNMASLKSARFEDTASVRSVGLNDIESVRSVRHDDNASVRSHREASVTTPIPQMKRRNGLD